MKKESIESKAKKAIELIRGVDEEFKTVAFSVVFTKILDKEENIEHDTKDRNIKSSISNSNSLDIEQRKKDFAKQCDITVAELDDVFRFTDNVVKVIAPLSGRDPSKQLIAAKCILTAFDIVYGKSWVMALNLSKCIAASKVGQLSHLSHNLKKDKQSIKLQGNNRNAKYKITEYGKALTLDIIQQLAKGELMDESKNNN